MKCVNCAGPRTPERCRYCGDGAPRAPRQPDHIRWDERLQELAILQQQMAQTTGAYNSLRGAMGGILGRRFGPR